ncbi:1-acyl-sn-glycerol-3-phosphate acyltransferase [Myxococcota bacterium]|nr:1-acyl-sn-glycerol-3-phosphate acyltransferase [Myxococcota bacterium]
MPDSSAGEGAKVRGPGARRGAWAFALFWVSWPLWIWLALTRLGPRAASGLVLGCLALLLWRGRRRGLGMLAVQAGGGAVLSLATLVTGHPAFLYQAPVLVSAFLLGTFLWTIRRPPPMIERYALLVKPDLSPGEKAHCRAFTWIWIAFFLANMAVTEWLALRGDPAAWALWSGALAYGAMGLIFAAEWVIRQVRFGDRRRWRTAFHTVAFYAPWALVSGGFTLLAYLPLRLLSPVFPSLRKRFRRFAQGFYRFQMTFLTWTGTIRIASIEGEEDLARADPRVIVANHRTLLDVLILMSRVPEATCLLKPLRRSGADPGRHAMPDFWKPFILGPFSLLGYIPMPEDWRDPWGLRRVLDLCRAQLAEGRPLIIFPEGTRSPDGRLLPFQDLPFRVAREARVPLQPVAIHTDVRFMPQGTVGIDADRRCTFRIRVLPCIDPRDDLRARDLLVETRQHLVRELRRMEEAFGPLWREGSDPGREGP